MKHRHCQVRCAICEENTHEVIGATNLLNIDYISRNAEFSIMIGEKKHQGKGIGTLATRKMLNYAFDHLNLHRIYLRVLIRNKTAISVYEKCGFVKEGIARQSVFKNGRYHDQLLMSILSTEYKTINQRWSEQGEQSKGHGCIE
jgi:RimJ/RimL family protein N-acetyltransferase